MFFWSASNATRDFPGRIRHRYLLNSRGLYLAHISRVAAVCAKLKAMSKLIVMQNIVFDGTGIRFR
jgi:hypothetical protein